ncbi:hypothetical protein JR316_0005553 [Psilocybe cubensis]|nr:hypothetical protein JR316_0005553 [Psilocybe cubensis]KAH9481034.1 hypothetical protein JR316_0005553 [Psilocybe cubensis]
MHTPTTPLTRLSLVRCPEQRESDEKKTVTGTDKLNSVKSVRYEAMTFSERNVMMNPIPPDWLRIPALSLSELESLDICIDHSLDIIPAFALLSQQRCLQRLAFEELEHLDITLSLHYKLNYYQWNFGGDWGALDRLLAPAETPMRFTKLKEVNVLVITHATQGEIPSAGEWVEDESHLAEGIQKFVYPVYFSGLRKLSGVKLSLRTEIRCA